MDKKKVYSYRDLLVWQKARALTKKGLRILRTVKRDFVSQAIIAQLVRSLFSVRSNIVEGWCSHQGKSFASYLEISRGSTGETEDWFSALYEEGYISRQDFEDISRDCQELLAMLTGLVRKVRSK